MRASLVLALLLLPLVLPSPSEAGRRRGGVEEHVLNRAGYGPDAWTRARIADLGPRDYLDEQLHPQTLDDSALEAQLARFPSLEMGFEELYAHPDRGDFLRELREARVLRAVASRRQLQEVLVDFWWNHFNVYAMNVTYRDLPPYERTLRAHVLGSFEDLLLATVRSPAMLIYLDNDMNAVGNLNENYAREIMELHTLGVGNFTEEDMVEAARCLTGLRVDITQPDGIRFDPTLHDQGAKTLFDGALQIPANGASGGYQDILDFVHYIATHPDTAQRISRKLAIRFVSEDPPSRLVEDMAATFLATEGDLRAVMETLLSSHQFFREEARRARVKRPLHVVASASRALGAAPESLNLYLMGFRAGQMGEFLLRARPPTGYPDDAAFWLSPAGLLTRFNTVELFATGGDGHVFSHPQDTGSAPLVDALIARFFMNGVSSETRSGAIALVDALGLPVGAAQRAEQASAYLLSSPEFLHH